MHRIFLALVVLISANVISPAQAKDNKTSDQNIRSSIEAASKKFVEAFGKGDASRIADMYADGALVMPPNGQNVQGRQKIQEFWQGLISTGAKFALTTTHVEGKGNVVSEVGTYRLTFADNKSDEGKFIVVWKREKGDWKLAFDIWNSNMPPAGQ